VLCLCEIGVYDCVMCMVILLFGSGDGE